MRDAIAACGKMGISDMPIKNKLEFEDFMNKKRDEIEINGRTFRWQSKSAKLPDLDSFARDIKEPLLTEKEKSASHIISEGIN